jgi:hypothetical protein
MMDNPDVNMTYRHLGQHSNRPPDSKRYLSAFGRDVDVPDFEIDYHAPTRELFATGLGGRSVAKEQAEVKRARDAIMSFDAKGEKPNKKELFKALHWTYSGRGSAEADKWYEAALDAGYIRIAEGGKGREKLHEPGQASAPARFRLADGEGEELS